MGGLPQVDVGYLSAVVGHVTAGNDWTDGHAQEREVIEYILSGAVSAA